MSKGISVTDSMLAAMAAGCVLHDVYSAGFKSRPALYYRELRHSDGRTKAVTAGVINRLAEDGLIESTGRSIARIFTRRRDRPDVRWSRARSVD